MALRETQVTCPAGAIVGTSDGRVRTFHSVPFARIGAAFDPPSPAPTGMLIDATLPHPDATRLTLTTPEGARPNTDLPVLVWIHGGRFEEGSHADPRTNAAAFARGGIVHVALGYRLKFSGMLPVSGDAPHEYRAVQDCAAALSWIQRNIEAFGGDPTNVTVVGQSAGADIALWLARRDHYKGEFRRLVAASPVFPRAGMETRRWAARGALGTPLLRGELNALAARKPRRLDRAYRRFRTQYLTDIALGPFPFDATALADVPLVVTSTRDEFMPAGARVDRAGAGPLAARAMARHFGVAKGEARAYLERAADMDPRQVAGRLLSDAMCRRWVDDVAERAPGTVWQAELVASDARPAYHASELAPAFGRTDGRSAVDTADTANAANTTDTTSGSPLFAWLTRFVRTGEVGWRPYREAGSVTCDRTALRVALDGTGAHEVADPLGYLRGVFTPVVREY